MWELITILTMVAVVAIPVPVLNAQGQPMTFTVHHQWTLAQPLQSDQIKIIYADGVIVARTVNAQGRITALGTADQFRQLLASDPKTGQYAEERVVFNSPGGSLGEGMELGRVIRAHKMNTTIGQLPVLSDGRPRQGLCGSACTFAFVGGVLRDAGTQGSVYAVHRFSLQDPGPDAISIAQQINAEMLTYLTVMGIDLRLIALMGQVPKESAHPLSPQEMANLQIIRLAKLVTQWELIQNNPVTVRGITEGKDGKYTLDFQCVSQTSTPQTSAPVRQLFLTVHYKDTPSAPRQVRIHPVTFSGTYTRFELSAEEFEPPNPAIVQTNWDVGVSLRIKMSPRLQELVLNEPELGILLGHAELHEFALVRSMQSDLSDGKQLLQGFFANCR